MRVVRLPLIALARHPVRTLLTAIGVGAGVACYVMMMGLSRSVDRAWTQTFEIRGADVLAVRQGAVEILSTSIDESLVDAVRARPEIADAAGELVDFVPVSDTETAVAYGWAPGSFLWNSLRLSAGRLPRESGERSVVVGHHVAEAQAVGIGSTLVVLGDAFSVAGVFKGSGVLLDNAIVMPIRALQPLLLRDGSITAINVRLSAEARRDPGQALKRLSRAFPGLTFYETATVASDNRVLGMLRGISWLTSTIALIVASIVVINTMLISVADRRREIGILSSIGWSRGRILSLIIAEALCLCAAGGAIGGLAARWGFRELTTTTAVGGWVDPDLPWSMTAEGVVAAVLFGVAASVYPAWLAASVPPADAFRHE